MTKVGRPRKEDRMLIFFKQDVRVWRQLAARIETAAWEALEAGLTPAQIDATINSTRQHFAREVALTAQAKAASDEAEPTGG